MSPLTQTPDQLADILVRSYNAGAGRTACVDGQTALAIVAALRGTVPAVCECHGVPSCPSLLTREAK